MIHWILTKLRYMLERRCRCQPEPWCGKCWPYCDGCGGRLDR
jgi:hypothetical protein